MQISDSQTDEISLAAFGVDAIQRLCAGDIAAVVDRYGYAIALGREPSDAIRDDLASCLDKVRASSLLPEPAITTASVKYFVPNDSGLFALVQAVAPAENGAGILVELIVTTCERHMYVSLEQLSVAA
jgi:hypothetical protein